MKVRIKNRNKIDEKYLVNYNNTLPHITNEMLKKHSGKIYDVEKFFEKDNQILAQGRFFHRDWYEILDYSKGSTGIILDFYFVTTFMEKCRQVGNCDYCSKSNEKGECFLKLKDTKLSDITDISEEFCEKYLKYESFPQIVLKGEN